MIRLLLLAVLMRSVFAGISEDMNQFFDRMGYSSNVSGGGAFSDQSAGYYTGGSIVARTQARNTQLATVQLPHYRAGCGGIDLFTGGFSFIKSQELIQALRGVGSNMASYAFMLGLQTMSPQIYNTLNELNAIAQKINAMNINSCETASTLLGGVWPKSDMASAHLCKSMGSSLGMFSDHADARHGCGVGGKRERALDRKGDQESFKRILVGEYNVAWQAIQENAFLKADPRLAELFMTLSGTIISAKNGNSYSLQSLPSKADSPPLMTALLDGGSTALYKCRDELKCLDVKEQNATIPASHAFRAKVSQTLRTLVEKIYEDQALTDSEKAFLNTTKLPVYKILNVLTAFKRGSAPVDVQEYVDVIALDMVCQYILDVLDLLHDNLAQLKQAQVDDHHITQMQQGLHQARSRIIEKRASVFQQLQTLLSMIQKTQNLERHLHRTFTLVNESES